MRHCENCGFLGVSGYEYPESYCSVGVQENDPKFDEDETGLCDFFEEIMKEESE